MSEGLWDGEQRYVVHCLPMEEGLPKVHRLTIEIMQRIWGGGGQQQKQTAAAVLYHFPFSPPVMWCGGFDFLGWFFFVWLGFFWVFFFWKSFVFQNEALVAKEKH